MLYSKREAFDLEHPSSCAAQADFSDGVSGIMADRDSLRNCNNRVSSPQTRSSMLALLDPPRAEVTRLDSLDEARPLMPNAAQKLSRLFYENLRTMQPRKIARRA
jgi:hypothetical protein